MGLSLDAPDSRAMLSGLNSLMISLTFAWAARLLACWDSKKALLI
jgi:hypothetical protein